MLEITTEELEQQIEQWTAEKQQMVQNLNMLEGAIQGYRGLIHKINSNGAEEVTAPEVPSDTTIEAAEKMLSKAKGGK